MNTKRWRRVLIGIDAFAALSGLQGGLMVITGWPYQFPLSWLRGTPFADYLVPGLILGVVVGGSALVAAVATWKNLEAGAVMSVVAGAIMAGWIIGEVLILQIYTWLQPFYFVVGAAMVLLAVKLAPQGWRGIVRRVHPA